MVGPGLHAQKLPEHHPADLVIVLEIILFLLVFYAVFRLEELPFGTVLVAALAVVVAGGLAGNHGWSLLSRNKEQPSLAESPGRTSAKAAVFFLREEGDGRFHALPPFIVSDFSIAPQKREIYQIFVNEILKFEGTDAAGGIL